MREVAVEGALCAGVEALGGMCSKHVDPGRRGAPDRIVQIRKKNRKGKTIYVETKAPNGSVKSWQERYHEDLRRCGAEVWVIWNLAQVQAFLEYLAKL